LVDAGIDARLTLVGEDPDQTFVGRVAGALGIDNGVVFVGEQSDPRPFLARNHVFVLPSRPEGFSNALLEAMASGLPAIATDAGGKTEAPDERGGNVMAPADSAAVTKAIKEIAAGREGLRAMGRHNRKPAATVFSIDSSAHNLAEWYLHGSRTQIGSSSQGRD
jgi:glycosyltransferase involved in cell wall biosynthesis